MRYSFYLFAFVSFFFAAESNGQLWKTQVGWTQLFSEVGPGLENGSGVSVAMAENPANVALRPPFGDFMPDITNGEFSGKTILNGTSANNIPTGHATSVAAIFFGNSSSIAPGVTNATAYSVIDWVENKLGLATGADPVAQPFKVHNNSWIANITAGFPAAAVEDAARRADFVARTNQMTIVGGTNNGSANPLPGLLAHQYNALIVGISNGNHASGLTSTYGPGRVRPNIVAPASIGNTSGGTAIVSSVATLLHDKATGTLADRADTMRAVILAGATKNGLAGWDRTTTRPLDEVYGAGQVNVYNSYKILDAGQFAGSTTEPVAPVGEKGWDYQGSIVAGNPMYYDFVVNAGQSYKDFSIILSWDMIITDTNADPGIFAPSELLGNLNLDFFDSTGSFLGNLVDSSASTVENVEHLFFTDLNSGRYTLRVSSDTTRDFALAWHGSVIPEPGAAMGILMLATMGFLRRRRRFVKA